MTKARGRGARELWVVGARLAAATLALWMLTAPGAWPARWAQRIAGAAGPCGNADAPLTSTACPALAPSSLGSTPLTLTPFVTLNEPTALAFAGTRLIVSQMVGQTALYNGLNGLNRLVAVSPSGAVSPFAPSFTYPGLEPHLAVSPGTGGFPDGYIYLAAYDTLYQIAPDGSTVTTLTHLPFATVSDLEGVTFDTVGTFHYDLLLITCLGYVYTVDPAGTLTQVFRDADHTCIEGGSVVPSSWGSAGGQLITSHDGNGQAWAISPGGAQTVLAGGMGAADTATYVPSTVSSYGGMAYFAANTDSNVIEAAPPGQVGALSGQVLVGDENGNGNLYALAPTGSSYAETVAAVGPGNYEEGAVATPLLTLRGNHGIAGSPSTAILAGFAPREAVTLSWGGAGGPVLGQGTTDANGLLGDTTPAISFAVPAGTPPGTYTVRAAGTHGDAATVPFVVPSPTLSLRPSSGGAGTVAVAAGEGFRAGEHVTLTWGGTGLVLGTATADARGAFGTPGAASAAITFTVPATAGAGQSSVQATGLSGTTAAATFTVAPNAQLEDSPASDPPGGPFLLSGSGFLPHESVLLTWDSPTGPALAGTTTDTSGAFGAGSTAPTANVAVPASQNGRHTIYAEGTRSGFQATTTFNVVAGITLAPAAGGPGAAVSVSGVGFDGGEVVNVTINGTPVGTGSADSSGSFGSGAAAPPIMVTIPAGATGSLQVVARDVPAGAAATSTFTVQGAPATPTPTSGPPATPTPTGTPSPACPAPWSCADVGSPALAGTQALTGATWTLQGAGTDLQSVADQFHFVWHALGGDGAVTAHLLAQTPTSPWAKTGVMLRASTNPGAAYYAVLATPQHGMVVQYRAAQGGLTHSIFGPLLSPPVYLRVTRAGTAYEAYTSRDGQTWTAVPGSTVTLPLAGAILAGLAVTSHNVNALGTAVFDSFTSTSTAATTIGARLSPG